MSVEYSQPDLASMEEESILQHNITLDYEERLYTSLLNLDIRSSLWIIVECMKLPH